MRKILIPTKLNSIAKSMLEDKGYTVIQDADSGNVRPFEDFHQEFQAKYGINKDE